MTSTDIVNRDGDIAAAGEELVSSEAASGAPIARFAVDDEQAVAAAVERARDAAGWWWAEGFDGRARHLLRWRAEIARGAEELSELIHRENGKTLDTARAELLQCIDLIAWAADRAPEALAGRDVPSPLPHIGTRIEQRPYGVVGVIGPWNFPAMTPMGLVAFAMAAGNAVVFKPSEVTPAVGRWLADAWERAVPGRPVLQTVVGFAATGQALVEAGVDKVAFTGSVRTGRAIMRAAAERLTPMLLELGGNDAAIVAADADLDTAAEDVVWGAFANTGLGCIAIERAIVVDDVHDDFVARVVERTEAIRGGDDPDPQLGAIPLRGHVESIRRQVADALERGARVVAGDPDAIRHPFARPLVLADVPRDALMAREETFGPTLAIMRAADEEDAIAAANGTSYALGSAVFSRERGVEIARRLRAGMTSVNGVMTFGMVSALPFGGGGGVSGFGRKHGDEGLREFAQPHSFTIKLSEPQVNRGSFAAPSGFAQAALAHVAARAIEQADAGEAAPS